MTKNKKNINKNGMVSVLLPLPVAWIEKLDQIRTEKAMTRMALIRHYLFTMLEKENADQK